MTKPEYVPVRVPKKKTVLSEMMADLRWRSNCHMRFWRLVDAHTTDGCWLWVGASKSKDKGKGYGNFKIAPKRHARAHRLSYALFHGVDPGEFFVCHACDTPACVNPNHLFLGNAADNAADMARKGRGKNGGSQQGSGNHNAKLREREVEVIRQMSASGKPNTEIAKEFGITHQMVSKIKKRKNWNHD